MKNYKHERVEKLLIQEINTLIVMGKVKDPRVSHRATVLHTKISRDLSSATLYVSSLISDTKLEQTVEALNHARGYIQKQIAQKFNWKNTPKLFFKRSQGLKNEFRVTELLSRVSDSMNPGESHKELSNPSTEQSINSQ